MEEEEEKADAEAAAVSSSADEGEEEEARDTAEKPKWAQVSRTSEADTDQTLASSWSVSPWSVSPLEPADRNSGKLRA